MTITSLSRYSCFPRCIFSYCPTPMSFLPRNLTGALPRSYPRKVVSHFLAGMHLSSCTVSHRQYSFSQFGTKQKHRKMPTTQAEFLLSEGKPLTVLGQSQWWSIIGSAYANWEHKYSIAVFRPVRNYRIYVRKCQEKFCSPLKICCRPIPMPFLPRSSTAALPCSYPRKVVSHFLAGINLSSCTASHHNPRIWKTKSTARH